MPVARRDKKEIIKAFKVDAVDTTGAGDSFWGGFLSCFLTFNTSVDETRWTNLKKAALTGNAIDTLYVQKRGGIPAIPSKEDVILFMRENAGI